MERMALERIEWQLEVHRALDPMGTELRAQFSTQDSLLLLHNDVIHRPSCYDLRIVVAIEVRKLFDSLPHEAVLKGTCKCGIKGKALAFIESFLTDRRYRVKRERILGLSTANRVGVPHGSVFSPT